MFSTLLLPTDGSHDSHAAVEHAAALARATGARIVVLEVVESPDEVWKRASAAGWLPAGGGFLNDENVARLIEAEQGSAADHLHALEAELRRAGVEHVESRVVQGRPGPMIVETAQQAGCDAIVMATHGRSGCARVLLGSVADYVARCADCAVVLVPAERRGASSL
jgi:nucleotide-binding universal stress UspA family protein